MNYDTIITCLTIERLMMQIEVLDKIMGTGKTYSTLRYIENLVLSDKSEKWIYCTEYLDELDINMKVNPDTLSIWKTPNNIDSNKTNNFKELLNEPNVQLIGITHALLINASRDNNINYLIKHKGYKLFLDETISLISPYHAVKFGDFLKALNRNDLSIDNHDYGKVTWLNQNDHILTGGFNTSTDKLKYDSSLGLIYCALRSGSIGDSNSISLVEIDDPIIFTQFNRVVLSTYQLKDTIFDSYLYMKGFSKVEFVDVTLPVVDKKDIRNNITFITKFDNTFKGRTILSGNWYNSNTTVPATVDDFKKLNSIIKSIGDKNGCRGNAHLLGFTVPADKLGKQSDARKIQPKGYPHTVCSVVIDDDGNETKGDHCKTQSTYIPCNARASNSYSSKNVMIHAYNRYPLQPVSNYLTHYNIPFSAEKFALNELVQWVWRCAIRKGEPVKLAILSSRMRSIFKEWLDSN